MILTAQAVPTAALLPCIAALPPGWQAGGADISSGKARLWLDSDRAGPRAVAITLTATCDTSGAEQVPPGQSGTRRFERPLSLAGQRMIDSRADGAGTLLVFPSSGWSGGARATGRVARAPGGVDARWRLGAGLPLVIVEGSIGGASTPPDDRSVRRCCRLRAYRCLLPGEPAGGAGAGVPAPVDAPAVHGAGVRDGPGRAAHGGGDGCGGGDGGAVPAGVLVLRRRGLGR